MHHRGDAFSNTTNFVRFKSHERKIGEKLPGLIAQILISTRPHRTEVLPPDGCASSKIKDIWQVWFVERTLVLVPPNSRLEASTANGVDGLSTPSRNSKVNGISLSPLARKTSAADPSRNKKAAARVPRTIALGLYNDIMPPQGRGALHYRHQNGKRSAVLQPRQGTEHGASSSHARAFAPALSSIDPSEVPQINDKLIF